MRGIHVGHVMRASLLGLSVGLVPALAACAGGDAPRAEDVDERAFDRRNFSDPTRIDNRWLPLVPGTRYVLRGSSNRGAGLLPHRVVFTVTDLTKVIDGVRTRVLWDRDYNEGRLLEGELAFHAQDDDGNVWNMGEYPEQYRRGRFAGAPDTWLSGVDGARAGILMRAAPRPATPSYLQGWAPAIDFADRARIYRTGERSCVPLRCYRGVLVTDEWTPDEPGAHQRKYYAAGVGNIRVAPAGGEEHEGLVLTRVTRLGPAAMAAVRTAALRLDARAYVARSDVYRRAPPARRQTRDGER